MDGKIAWYCLWTFHLAAYCIKKKEKMKTKNKIDLNLIEFSLKQLSFKSAPLKGQHVFLKEEIWTYLFLVGVGFYLSI